MKDQWTRPEAEAHHFKRLKGSLEAKQSTKQLIKLLIPYPNSTVLDVGCNVGHFYKEIKKHYPGISYIGIDKYPHYIRKAKSYFKKDKQRFRVHDIQNPLYVKFDVTFCCEVLLHLPDFRVPLKNILNSTKKTCFIRTLVGEKTTIVKTCVKDEFDVFGEPSDYNFYNTWSKSYLKEYIESLGWKCEFIEDETDLNKIDREAKFKDKVFSHTRRLGNMQIVDNIILEWKWLRITINT